MFQAHDVRGAVKGCTKKPAVESSTAGFLIYVQDVRTFAGAWMRRSGGVCAEMLY